MAKQQKGRKTGDKRLFTIKVTLLQGPLSDAFWEKNEEASRTIQICSHQTLIDLHIAIFDAFNREDEHVYQFEIGGKEPYDPKARRYTPEALEDELDQWTTAKIGSLGLKPKDVFLYGFDLSVDWWHELKVMAIEDEIPPGEYPKITERVGDSPPQYPDLEDEYDEEDMEDDDEKEDEDEETEEDVKDA